MYIKGTFWSCQSLYFNQLFRKIIHINNYKTNGLSLKLKIHMNYTWICEYFTVYKLKICICCSVTFLLYKYKIYMHCNNSKKKTEFFRTFCVFFLVFKITVMVKYTYFLKFHIQNSIYWFQNYAKRMKNVRVIEITLP